ncbi:MAG: aldehyde:ferredoxin oxidoreductase [Candidatus Thorarchaeota archaeon]|nr:MAG: aldehyde:ferredoxin oxidoreductase [Candidatus Thorarchaeota archaeon]
MVLMEMKYDIPEIRHGYANQTLYVDLSKKTIEVKPVDEKMKETFTGGKGFDLWLMWNGLPKDRVVKWDDPENEICIATGPLGGVTTYPGAGKSIVTAISPLTGQPIDSNVGGYFGPHLKFSGFDAMEIQGCSAEEVYIFIDGDEGLVQILNAGDLPDNAYDITRILTDRHTAKGGRDISVVSAGPGADHAWMGCLNFSWWDNKREEPRYKQAGRGGTGTVLRNKRVKALVAKKERLTLEMNGPADLDMLKAVAREHSKEILELDSQQNRMRVVGTAHLPGIMDEFDLLPTRNFRAGSDPEAKNLHAEVWEETYTNSGKGWDGCWRPCAINCSHCIEGFVPKTGPFAGKKVIVDGPEYETIAGCGSNLGIFVPHWVAELNFYCDAYGIDTISFGTTMGFVMELFSEGYIDEKATGGHNLEWGAAKAALAVLHEIASGEGFGGEHFGKGVQYLKGYFASSGADVRVMEDIGMVHKGLEYSLYVTKESLAQQGGYGLTLKGPQHDEAWLIFLDMVHNYMPTFDDKAEALHYFPMWRTWFGLNGLCKLPWNDVVPPDNSETDEPAKVPRHVAFYARLFSAMTGRQVDGDDLVHMSEKVYNFQRIFNIRQGKGLRVNDSNPPYRSIGPVTAWEYESRQERYDSQLQEKCGIDCSNMTSEEKLAKLKEYRMEQYMCLTDAVYKRRGWTRNGVPTMEKVNSLGLDWIPDLVTIVKEHQADEPPSHTLPESDEGWK